MPRRRDDGRAVGANGTRREQGAMWLASHSTQCRLGKRWVDVRPGGVFFRGKPLRNLSVEIQLKTGS